MERLTIRQLTGEQRFHLFLEAATDYAIFFMDEKGMIIEWSAGAEAILRRPEADALGQNARFIFTPEDRAGGVPEQEMMKAVRNGQANDERWHVRGDGTRLFAIGRLIALRSETGEVYGFAKILRDATPYKSLEEALRLSEEQYRLTFAQSPLGMMVLDLNGRILQANASLCTLLGYRDEDLRGKPAIELTVPEERDKIQEEIRRLFTAEDSTFLIEKRMLRANGGAVWVQNSGAILRDGEGRPVSIIDLCQDITFLKLSRNQLEELVNQRTSALNEKTKQMESFCFTVAHDLRAPLRTIAGFAEILTMDFGALPRAATQYLQKIQEGAQRLDRLIQDLLSYTRVQQVALIREDVDVGEVVEFALRQLQQDITTSAAVVRIETPLPRVAAHAATLEHVFLNLLSNALKFSREGDSPKIEIYAEERGRAYRVWVQDNGIGIDPKFSDRIFRIFERVHDSRKYPGTGVGLAIVATAMDRVGGRCGVEPNPSGGSRFWLDFPRPDIPS